MSNTNSLLAKPRFYCWPSQWNPTAWRYRATTSTVRGNKQNPTSGQREDFNWKSKIFKQRQGIIWANEIFWAPVTTTCAKQSFQIKKLEQIYDGELFF